MSAKCTSVASDETWTRSADSVFRTNNLYAILNLQTNHVFSEWRWSWLSTTFFSLICLNCELAWLLLEKMEKWFSVAIQNRVFLLLDWLPCYFTHNWEKGRYGFMPFPGILEQTEQFQTEFELCSLILFSMSLTIMPVCLSK